eukprot:01542.XXX_315_734_1 [CDS] Oithona nana genome sequencing.
MKCMFRSWTNQIRMEFVIGLMMSIQHDFTFSMSMSHVLLRHPRFIQFSATFRYVILVHFKIHDKSNFIRHCKCNSRSFTFSFCDFILKISCRFIHQRWSTNLNITMILLDEISTSIFARFLIDFLPKCTFLFNQFAWII